MDKHTPGPWTWRANTAGHSIYLLGACSVVVMGFQRWGMRGATPVFHDATFYLCKAVEWAVRPQAHNSWNVTDIDHPDARLIAAAPELLAALRALVSYFEDDNPGGIQADGWLHKLHTDSLSAIAKAVGKESGRE